MPDRVFRIAVLAGDGIGPEVTAEAVRLVRQAETQLDGVRFVFENHSIGAAEYLARGDALPESVCQACQASDAVLLGAAGLPQVRYPDGREVAPQVDLREKLGLYGGIRPIRLYHETLTPLKHFAADEIDLVLVRESTEGLFFGREQREDLGDDEARNTLRITRHGAERISRLAFEIARKRRKRVTLVDKANILSAMVFFRQIFDEVSRQYPDCVADHVYVDAAALYLVRDPQRFDVLVTENMFGDILSDLAAGLVGGMGMAPSADVGEGIAIFQPSHGSAPDICGTGTANPVAAILSAAMMLEWLDHPETRRASGALNAAVAKVLSDPSNRTPDIGGRLSTEQMTDAISAALEETLGLAESRSSY